MRTEKEKLFEKNHFFPVSCGFRRMTGQIGMKKLGVKSPLPFQGTFSFRDYTVGTTEGWQPSKHIPLFL
ncbi:hypothetical protein HMPREF1141_0266 [Clostridium sp. MSTE9]|nr:hypothetical protein HMPREF1141_0266 [Clostridium sp. MSTE9]